jgi:hypothetical protein
MSQCATSIGFAMKKFQEEKKSVKFQHLTINTEWIADTEAMIHG